MSGPLASLQKARVAGAEVEYRISGTGEPVLFIHGSIIADAFAPLLSQPSLTDSYQVVNYHRRGYAGSTHSTAPVGIVEQATDARTLLDLLEIERVHVVGHSYGGLIALQLALAAPDRVHSLALLEPGIPTQESAAAFIEQIQPLAELYQTGETANIAGAIDAFCQAVAGEQYRAAFDGVLATGWFEQAVHDASTFFEVEAPAMLDWELTPESASGIRQPTLLVLGAESAATDPTAPEAHELLQRWMPQAEPFVLPRATHALQLMNPVDMAHALARFFRSHPMSVRA